MDGVRYPIFSEAQLVLIAYINEVSKAMDNYRRKQTIKRPSINIAGMQFEDI